MKRNNRVRVIKNSFRIVLVQILFLLCLCIFSACGSVEFKINFVVDDEIVETISTSGNETIKLPDNPTKAGYTFEGWYWDKDIWEQPFTTNSLLCTPFSSEVSYISVYAKFISKKYNINYYLDGGINGFNPNSYYAYTEPILLEDAYKEGFIFAGWYLDENYSTKIVSIESNRTGHLNLYAKWDLIKYSITFNSNGGSYVDSISDVYGTSIRKPDNPTKEGFIFDDWYIDNNFTTPFIFDMMPNSNITLYAKWIPNAESNNLVFSLDSTTDTYSVTGYSGTDDVVTISSTHYGKTVNTITRDAFKKNANIKQIILPNTITNIGSEAFSGCISLESIVLGHSLTSICSKVFYGCINLKKITFGDSIQSIGNQAFEDCMSLDNVVFKNKLTSIGDDAFLNCINLQSIIIGSKLTSIGAGAFNNTAFLNNTNNAVKGLFVLTSEGNLASYVIKSSDTLLTSVDIPNNTEIICDNAFLNNNLIKSITIPENVKKIGDNAFKGMTSLIELNYNAVDCQIINSSHTLFGGSGSGGKGITVNIGSSVKKIPAYLFYSPGSNPTYITTINFKSKLGKSEIKEIGVDAFRGCTFLSKVNLEISIDTWSEIDFKLQDSMMSFSGYSNPVCYSKGLYVDNKLLTNLNLTTATKINGYAFYGCKSITNVVIGKSVKTIGDYAFYGCSNIGRVYYKGTLQEKNQITLGTNNQSLTGATWYYYTENNPFEEDNAVDTGNYWYYDIDGVTPVIWNKED